MKRSSALLALSLTLVMVAVFAPSPAGAIPYPSDFCADVPAPCIVSATRNSVAVTSANPDWGFQVVPFSSGGSNTVTISVIAKTFTPYVLGSGSLSDVWIFTVDMGTTVPRVSDIAASGVTVQRIDDGDGTYKVTITATPVVVSGGCDQSVWPWTCPMTATEEWDGYLNANVTDYGAWDDVSQRVAMYGMDHVSNISAGSIPAEIVNDPATGYQQLLFRLANPHFRMDGTTVFLGNLHERIPNAFLKEAYGVDDPATLTGSGLVASVSGGAGGGTIAVTQEPSGDAMLVDVTGMTFSARTLRIKRGTITPAKPTGVVADRTGATKGTLSFVAPDPRGSKIVGFSARCVRGSAWATARYSASPIVVSRLQAGTSYSCKVRANSKAGAGAWSAPVTMPA